ncbi:MAG: helix-turn-helix domain-containing protein [Candidatus Dormibacteria bacterium]
MTDNDLLTVSEAAELFRTTTQAVYQWRRRRQGPPGAVIGSRLLFRREDLMRWVGEQVDRDQRTRRRPDPAPGSAPR